MKPRPTRDAVRPHSKSLLLVALLLLAACASRASAQGPAAATPPPDTLFHLGDRDVIIPAPAGFVEATTRSSGVKTLFETTESKSLDLLAVHLPADVMKRLDAGEMVDLDFYTKVSVSKEARAVKTTREEFARLAEYMRAKNSKVFDLKSPQIQEQLRRQNKGLTELLNKETSVDISEPLSLGVIDSTPDSFGALMLAKATVISGGERKEKTLVGGMSFVRIRERLVFVYTYRLFKSESDADTLRDFTKRWVADILRANAP